MGVRGLSSYVTGCQRACSEHVDLNYGGSDRDTTSAADRDGPVSLAVDGLALVYHIMQNAGVHDLRLELGWDYDKEATTLERRRSQAADASEVMVLMQPGGEGTDATFLQQHCSSLLPLFAVETLAAACISAGVSIRSADREADPELAAACQGNARSVDSGRRRHRCPALDDAGGGVGVEGGCDAVLSNDSDFLVMDIPGYIPFWSLGVGADGSAGALVFRRTLVAARLGIPADWMPDLACLVGNDWIQPENHVHRRGQLYSDVGFIELPDHPPSFCLSPIGLVRVIMQSAATSAGCNSGHERKRKGTAAHNAGALASSSAPWRRGGNGNGSSSSNGLTGAASAKHLVEATARYLSEFLRHNKVPRDRCGVNDAVSPSQVDPATGGDDRGRLLAGEADQSMTRELCARFFPALTAGRSGGVSGAEGAHGQDEESPQTGLAGTSSTKSAGHRAPKQQRASRAKKGKGHKNKRPSGNDRGGGSTTGCGSRGGQRDAGMGEEDAARGGIDAVGEEEDGESFLREFLAARLHYEVPPLCAAGEDQAEDETLSHPLATTGLAATVSGGGLVLSRVGLRAGIWAPPEIAQAVLEGVFWCRMMLEDSVALENAVIEPAADYTEPTRPTGTDSTPSGTAASHSSAFASFSGVRKGIYEVCLAQLVGVRTAGCFSWAATQDDHSRDRSMVVATEGLLNDSAGNSAQSAVLSFRERCAAFASGGSAVPRREPQTTAASLPKASTASIQAPAPASPPAPAATPSPPPQAVAAAAAEPLGSRQIVAGGSDKQRRRGDKPRRFNGNDALGPRAAAVVGRRRHDLPPGRVTREGDEFVVREFRRVGTGVKTFRVVCKAPASLRLSASTSLPMRWNLCLSTLGLARRDNRLLTALMDSEVRGKPRMASSSGQTCSRTDSDGTEVGQGGNRAGRTPIRLTAVALVAALLLSGNTSTLSSSGRGEETSAAAKASLSLGSSWRAIDVSAGGNGVGSGREGESAIVVAFVTTVTRCFCGGGGGGGIGCHGPTLSTAASNTERGIDTKKARTPRQPGGVDNVGTSAAPAAAAPPLHSSRSCGWCPQALDGQGEEGVSGSPKGAQEARTFVNLWSKAQSAAWHVNACLAALRLIDDKGGGGGGGSNRCEGGRYIAPLDSLSLRPALAFTIFRQQTRGQPVPGQQGQSQQPTSRSCQQQQQQQQQQEQQQRSAVAAAAVGVDDGDGRQQPPRQEAGTRSSLGGKEGAKNSLPIGSNSSPGTRAPPVHRRISPNDDPAEKSPRKGAPHRGPIFEGDTTTLPGESQPEQTCCVHTPIGGSCGWTRRVEVVLDAAGFVG
ncbi:unnamed protein product [Ectocarpus sp. CCAP 1310/34]|nr:unnamed protein product [Ectocarpus sp. CCAP 1310/34]